MTLHTQILESKAPRAVLAALLAVLLTAAGLSLLAQAASAAEPAQSEQVRFTDTELLHADSIAQVHSRLHRAAERVCAPLAGRALDEIVNYRHCVDAAVDQAVAQIHRPALSAYVASTRH
ncbi:MAG TPA: UrcA family protein [Steroidobacteraceae bacterium]|nr:UrcA family protein [Steroidobacteraceae bacterium]